MDNLNFSDIEAVKAAFAAIQREKDAEKAQSADKDKLIAAEKARADAEKARADAEKARTPR
ncbi:hypothetical protein CFIMG_007672RA00001 [Ceratocystis fimbriata CBS 114723]|uniref:Uncharacterized protein n=1 Tax=Ceratocystis fimbriata CBS 114723 TaxID=1035309 RepID=A0A2C5WUU3_9PEZI|nr:hypothetical protein CFIMG_007672RA00001 [Ceratocystis fimbriata CBS 114723]